MTKITAVSMNIEEFEHKLAEWVSLSKSSGWEYIHPWEYIGVSEKEYYEVLEELKYEPQDLPQESKVEALDIAYSMMMLGAFTVGLIMAWELFKYIVGE